VGATGPQGPQGNVGATGPQGPAGNATGALLAANNLSDLGNTTTARSNLNVLQAGADTAYVWRANNLSDLGNNTTAQSNLGLGTVATKNTGGTGAGVPSCNTAATWSQLQTFSAGFTAAGNTSFTGNMSFGNTTQVRGALGLGTAATQNTGTSGANVPLLNGVNVWAAQNQFNAWINIQDANYALNFLDANTPMIGFDSGGDYLSYDRTNNRFIWKIGNVERLRISELGYLKASNSGTYYQPTWEFHEFVGNLNQIAYFTALGTSPYGVVIQYTAAAPNGAGNPFIQCADSAASRCYIYANGGIANYQSNNVNLSDAYVKAEVGGYTQAELDALETSFRKVTWGTFKYLDQTHDDPNHGYTAQDIETCFADSAPELVDEAVLGPQPGEGETLRKVVYDGDLMHIGMALLSRALARIAILEAQIAKPPGLP
jgi:hypothetical protein